jgi:hypothetical protein
MLSMIARRLGLLAVFVMVSINTFLAADASPAQQSPPITVRLIYATNGKPVRHRRVYIDRINPDTLRPILEPGMYLRGTTDDDGKVSFPEGELRSTPPKDQSSNGDGGAVPRKRLSKLIDLQITYAGFGSQCSTSLFSLDEILTSGAVSDNLCNKKFDSAKFKSIPGEVIIFVGKRHWWEGTIWAP